MKKWLIALGMTICLLGLTACGQEEDTTNYLTNDEALSYAMSAIDLVAGVVEQGQEEEILAQVEQGGTKEDVQMYKSAFESYSKALPDMGAIQEVGDIVSNTVALNVLEIPVEGSIVCELKGELRDAELEILFEHSNISSITVNVNYTFGESMEKAGLNTLLGMGTVFIVLILISLIISAFNLIPKIQAAFAKKPEKSANEKAVDSTIAQIIEKEELSDDLELVAVISAAIAAYEGTSGDGFVVRSIRRSR